MDRNKIALLCEISLQLDRSLLCGYTEEVDDKLQNVDNLLGLYEYIYEQTSKDYKYSELESVLRGLEDRQRIETIVETYIEMNLAG